VAEREDDELRADHNGLRGNQLGGRNETPTERLDRHWNELLQELRVSQTGVQVLSGFLLTLPFQNRFAGLDGYERTLYLVTVLLACAATLTLIAPVAVHRALFHRHEKDRLVAASHRLARTGLAALGATVCGVIALVFTVVLGRWQGVALGLALLVLLVLLWGVIPLRLRRSGQGRQPR